MATRLSSKKHTLDSDEEDDIEIQTRLTNDQIEGQEETTVDFEEGIRFTPFHMRDEMEEGSFDENGMYVLHRNQDEIRDKWIEEVNWSEIKHLEKALKQKKEMANKKEEEEEEEELDEIMLLKNMLALMNPKESVTAAIKRLGKSGGSSGAWKNKRAKLDLCEGQQTSGENNPSKSKQQLSDLIGCADKLLCKSMFSIYQDTYENIAFKISKNSGPSKSEQNSQAVDAVDMFGSEDPKHDATKTTTFQQKDALNAALDEVTWVFKWTNDANAEVHGPYSSQQMLQWQDEGYFDDGVFVKKSSEENKAFYSSNRIDFGLYL